MTGVQMTVQHTELDRAAARLDRLGRADLRFEMLDIVTAVAEGDVRERFDTKVDPDGQPWVAWSKRYAATRSGRHSLLVERGGLRDSIASFVNAAGTHVAVGSNLVYAAVHQFSGADVPDGNPARGIPARAFLGLSNQAGRDIEDAIGDFLADVVGP